MRGFRESVITNESLRLKEWCVSSMFPRLDIEDNQERSDDISLSNPGKQDKCASDIILCPKSA